MKTSLVLVLTLAATAVSAQSVADPKAGLIDVPARQAFLKTTKDSLVRDAVKGLKSCVSLPAIPAPTGRMEIPHHYLTGSNGPTNPAEKVATEMYLAFETRISTGMNQYVATGSHAESACALAQLDSWAKANALTDYDAKESTQAWFQVEWTLGSAGVTESILVTDPTLDPAQQKRVIAWLDAAAHKLIGWEKPGDNGNNHHYFRANTAISIGIVANDDKLFQFGINTYKQAVDDIAKDGAFPREMARHENAIHYQSFALQPLVAIAEFAERQHVDLYAYTSPTGKTIRDAIIFFGRAAADPSLVKPYTSDAQKPGYGADGFAPYNFYVARFGPAGLPPIILDGLKKQTVATRIGGNTTVLAAK